jgi:hypothetical protein
MAKLLKWLEGAAAQINPFDNGADFNSVQRRYQEDERRKQQQIQQQRNQVTQRANQQLGAQVQDRNGYYGAESSRLKQELAKGSQSNVARTQGLIQSLQNRQKELSDGRYKDATAFKTQERLEPMFKQGKSFEDIAQKGGFSDREVRSYASQYHSNYGDKGVIGNVARGVGQVVPQMLKSAGGIVVDPIYEVNKSLTTGGKAGKNDLDQINKDFMAGKITPEAAYERAQKQADRYTAKKVVQNKDTGALELKQGNVLEFGGKFAQQGIDTGSVLPMAGGIASGASKVAQAAGKPVVANGLAKAASTLTAGAQTQATSKLADAMARYGMGKNSANIIGNAITSNAKQSAMWGTAQTGADVAQGRGITPESLLLNYGADFAMGTLPEIGLGLGAPAIVKGGKAAKNTATQMSPELYARNHPNVRGYDDHITNLRIEREKLVAQGLSDRSAPLINNQKALQDALVKQQQEFQSIKNMRNRELQGGFIAGPLAGDFSKAKKQGLVFEGVDGKPRFEVDDSGASLDRVKDTIEVMLRNNPKGAAELAAAKNYSIDTNGKVYKNSELGTDLVVDKETARELLNRYEFSKQNDLEETIRAKQAFDIDVQKGTKPSDAYQKIRGSYGNKYADFVETLNQDISNSRPSVKKLSEVLDHPELYANYPELSNLKVRVDSKYSSGTAHYDARDNSITISPNANKKTILHEIQHAIQNTEGFAKGGSPKSIEASLSAAEAKELKSLVSKADEGLNGLPPKQQKRLEHLLAKGDGSSLQEYRHLAGEAEARAVEARIDMPMSERYVKAHQTLDEFEKSLNLMKWGKVTGVGQLPISKLSKAQMKVLLKDGLPENGGHLKVSDFKKGRKVTQPIEVSQRGSSYVVENGRHRLFQALANGDESVPVVFKSGEGKAHSLPIEEFYNKAKPQSTFYDSLDVPKDDLIVRNGGGRAMSETPKTVKVWQKSKFSDKGAYVDVPVVRKVENKTLYQGGKGEGRQFWTANKKYAEQFGEVTEKTGTFYEIDNGNRVTTVYVEAKPQSNVAMSIDDEFVKETASQYQSREQFVDELNDMLYESSRGGKGSVIAGKADELSGGYRVSENTPFYQAAKEQLGKVPNKAEVRKILEDFLDGENNAARYELDQSARDIAKLLPSEKIELGPTPFDEPTAKPPKATDTPAPRGSKTPRSETPQSPKAVSKELAKTGGEVIGTDTQTLTAPKQVSELPESRQSDRSLTIDNTTNVTKKRGLVKSVKGSDEVSSEVRRKVSGSYQVRSTEKLGLEAHKYAQGNLKKVTADVNERLAQKTGSIADQDIADSLAVAKRLDSEGKFDASQQIYDRLAEHGTKGGQAIQAFSLLQNRTPEGVKFQMLRNLKKAGVTLTNADQVKVGELIDKVRKTKPKTEARNRALFDTLDFVSRKIPTNTGDKIINFWRAGLLTAPKTTGGNIVGNATEMVSRELWANPVAIATDKFFSMFTGKRTKTTGGGILGGMKEGVDKGVDYLKTGYDPRNMGSKYDVNRRVNYNNKIIDGYVNGVYKWMGAQDQPFYYGAKAAAAHDLAKADGMNLGYKGKQLAEYVEQSVQDSNWKPSTFKTKKDVEDYARYAVYQNETLLGSMAANVKQAADRKGVRWVTDFVLPFTQVPSSVAMRVLDRTPIGTAREIVSQIRHKKFDQRAMAEAIGNGSFGIPVVAAGFALAQAGEITGDYPNDSREQKLWKENGKQPYSVRVGDKWYSLNYLQPFGTILSVGRQVSDDIKDGKSAAEAWMTATATAAQSVSDQSFLRGLNGVMSAINDPERSMGQFAKSTAGSVVPNFIRSFSTASDSVQRETKDAFDAVKGSIPGLRQTLPEKQGMFGNTLESKGSFADMYLNPLSPSRIKNENDPLLKELQRLQDKDNGIVTTSFGKTSIKDVELNDKQIRDLNKAVNSRVKPEWDKAIKDERYASLSDEDKNTVLKRIKDNVSKQVKGEFVLENGLKTTGKYAPTSSDPFSISEGGGGVTLNSRLSANSKHLLTKFGKTEKREKWFAENNDAEYEYYKAKYENDKANGEISKIEDVKRRRLLKKDEVGSKYMKDTRDLYSLSKEQILDYISNDKEKGQKLSEELLAYDRALYDAGLSKYLKFKNGLGTSTGGRKSSGRKSGGKGGSKAANNDGKKALDTFASLSKKTGVPKTDTDTSEPRTPQMRKAALKRYQVANNSQYGRPIPITTRKVRI